MISNPKQLKRLSPRLLLALVLLTLATATARACPYSIRDAAFVVRDRQPYRLVLTVDEANGTHAEWARLFREAETGLLRDTAIRVETHDPARPLALDLRKQAPGAAAWAAPSVRLVTPRGGVHVIGIPEGGWTAESVKQSLIAIAASPLRDELKKRLPEQWAAVVFLPGGDDAARASAREAIGKACKRIVGHPTELGRTVPSAPPVLTVDDPAREAWLLRTLEFDPGRDAPQAAIVVGRGRRIGSVLTGGDITETALWRTFVLLGRSCACTSDPRWLVGPAAPLVWPASKQREVARIIGFDPDSPRVTMELSAVWSMSGDESPLALPGETRGYREMIFGADMDGESAIPDEAYFDPDDPVPGEWDTPETLEPLPPAKPSSADNSGVPTGTLANVAALYAAIGVLALAAMGLMVWAVVLTIRKRRTD